MGLKDLVCDVPCGTTHGWVYALVIVQFLPIEQLNYIEYVSEIYTSFMLQVLMNGFYEMMHLEEM